MSSKTEFQPSYTNGGITPIQQMISSCSGALLTSVFVAPLDVVKIRLQAQHKTSPIQVTPLDVVKIRLQSQQKPISRGQCFLYCNGLMDHVCTCYNGSSSTSSSTSWYRRPGQFNGTFDAFIKISRSEGLSSLWSGLPPTLLMAVPATVIYFTAYDQLKSVFDQEFPSQKHWTPLLAGGVARLGAATMVNPLELIRTKMQSKKLSYLELKQVVCSAVDQRGFLSLWRGWGPTVLRDVPFSALYWFNYERFKRWGMQSYNISQPTFAITFTSGAAAGTVAAMLTNPFDVVKTHRQIELGELEVKGESWKASSTSKMLIKLYKERGVTGLYSGLTPRIIKIAPACAIMISSYEFGKSFFKHYNKRHAVSERSSFSQPSNTASATGNTTISPPRNTSPS